MTIPGLLSPDACPSGERAFLVSVDRPRIDIAGWALAMIDARGHTLMRLRGGHGWRRAPRRGYGIHARQVRTGLPRPRSASASLTGKGTDPEQARVGIVAGDEVIS